MFKKFFSLGINRLFVFLLVFVYFPISYVVYEKDIQQEFPSTAKFLEHTSDRVLKMLAEKSLVVDGPSPGPRFQEFTISIKLSDTIYRKLFIDVSKLGEKEQNTATYIHDELLNSYEDARKSVLRTYTLGYVAGWLFIALTVFAVLHGARWVILGFIPARWRKP